MRRDFVPGNWSRFLGHFLAGSAIFGGSASSAGSVVSASCAGSASSVGSAGCAGCASSAGSAGSAVRLTKLFASDLDLAT